MIYPKFTRPVTCNPSGKEGEKRNLIRQYGALGPVSVDDLYYHSGFQEFFWLLFFSFSSHRVFIFIFEKQKEKEKKEKNHI